MAKEDIGFHSLRILDFCTAIFVGLSSPGVTWLNARLSFCTTMLDSLQYEDYVLATDLVKVLQASKDFPLTFVL